MAMPSSAKPSTLSGLFVRELDGFDAEFAQHGRCHVVRPRVDRKVKLLVRLDGVGTLRLQRVGADLVGEADAAPSWRRYKTTPKPWRAISDCARSSCSATIALERAEDLARETFGVDAHRDVAPPANVAQYQGAVRFTEGRVRRGIVPPIHPELKASEAGRQRRFGERLQCRQSSGARRLVHGRRCRERCLCQGSKPSLALARRSRATKRWDRGVLASSNRAFRRRSERDTRDLRPGLAARRDTFRESRTLTKT